MLLLLLSCARHPAPDQRHHIGGIRPADLIVPSGWKGEPLPAVFLLHGLSSSARNQDRYMRFSRLVDELDFLLVLPDGMERSQDGLAAWNATDACCSPDGVDDVAYLSGLMDELEGMGATGFYFTGHSNGGFMSYRMACERPERIAAIASLAGATWLEAPDCAADAPVDILQIHGSDDATVPYAGRPGKYPGARETAARWAARAGCAPPVAAAELSLVLRPGAETLREVWQCSPPHRVELWTIEGAGHIPLVSGDYAREVVGWLLAEH
ncbi:MAG: alpha/beta hydrolase-fold protein [Myxococcota bacterium]|nr:alpha/beta hydrolase-fold protein [Myxococcota bacterium]